MHISLHVFLYANHRFENIMSGPNLAETEQSSLKTLPLRQKSPATTNAIHPKSPSSDWLQRLHLQDHSYIQEFPLVIDFAFS